MSGASTARADRALLEMQRQAADACRRGRDACDATHEQVAAQIYVSSGLLSQYVDAANTATISVARAALAPAPMRLELARFVAGESHAVVELPEVTAALGVDQAMRAQRETSEALSAHLTALARRPSPDGRLRLERADAAELARECDEAIHELLRIRAAAHIAMRDGVYTQDADAPLRLVGAQRGPR